MGIWDKLQVELSRAGQAAQGAIDEGRLRLEIFRVRQLADKAAQALGYAAYRAREKGEALDDSGWERLSATLREHEREATRLEAELARVSSPAAASPEAPAEPAAGEQPPAAGPTTGDAPPAV